MVTIIDRNGNRKIATSVVIPEHLHKIARERHIILSHLLQRSLEQELSKPESGAAI